MKFMTCNSCKAIVQQNPTGICLSCQKGFSGNIEEDRYEKIIEKEIEKLDPTSPLQLLSLENINEEKPKRKYTRRKK